MQKVFKNNQQCPFGKSCIVDSPTCRQCENYYGACGYLYIRCAVKDDPKQERAKQRADERAKKRAIKAIKTAPKRKPGRPKGTKKGPKK